MSKTWYLRAGAGPGGAIDLDLVPVAGRAYVTLSVPDSWDTKKFQEMMPELTAWLPQAASSGQTTFAIGDNGQLPGATQAPTPAELASPSWANIPAGTSEWLPSWYNQNAWIPTATPSPQVEFMEAVNRLMPQMSPQDYQPWLSYLRTQQPDVFTGYTPEAIAQYQPPQRTPEQERALNVPGRYEQAKQSLFAPSGIIDPDSPAREWLNSIFSTGQQLAPKTAAPESAPSKMQQQDLWRLLGDTQGGTGLLGSPTSYGVSQEQAGLWQPWLEQFLAPTTRNLPSYLPSNAPSWLTGSGMQAPITSVSRAGNWANPRWL